MPHRNVPGGLVHPHREFRLSIPIHIANVQFPRKPTLMRFAPYHAATAIDRQRWLGSRLEHRPVGYVAVGEYGLEIREVHVQKLFNRKAFRIT